MLLEADRVFFPSGKGPVLVECKFSLSPLEIHKAQQELMGKRMLWACRGWGA